MSSRVLIADAAERLKYLHTIDLSSRCQKNGFNVPKQTKWPSYSLFEYVLETEN